MKVKTVWNQFPVIEVDGDVEYFNAPVLLNQVDQIINQGFHNLILDFSNVKFVDSGGIEILFHILINIPDGHLALVTQNQNILRLLNMVGIFQHQSFSAHLSREKAITIMLEGVRKSA